MCDMAFVARLVAGLQAAIGLMAFLHLSALTTNATIFGAPAAPVFLGTALGVACGVLAMTLVARDHLANECPECASESEKLRNLLSELELFLAIYIVACGVAIVGAWIPYLGAPGIAAATIAWLVIPLFVIAIPQAYFDAAKCKGGATALQIALIVVATLIGLSPYSLPVIAWLG